MIYVFDATAKGSDNRYNVYCGVTYQSEVQSAARAIGKAISAELYQGEWIIDIWNKGECVCSLRAPKVQGVLNDVISIIDSVIISN